MWCWWGIGRRGALAATPQYRKTMLIRDKSLKGRPTSRNEGSITPCRTLSITPHALHRAVSSRSSKPPSTLALHQAARRALLRFVECVAYTPPTITHRGRSRRPRTQPSQPSAVHRPLSISRRSDLLGQPSVISRRRGARRPRSHRGPRSPPNATIAALHRAHSRP
jgi:hypothetical protein